jgi:hypothetical protein
MSSGRAPARSSCQCRTGRGDLIHGRPLRDIGNYRVSTAVVASHGPKNEPPGYHRLSKQEDHVTGIMTRRVRPIALAAGVAVLGFSLVTAGPANAASVPDSGHVESSASFDDAEYCADQGITFHVEETSTIDFTVTFNDDGSWRFAIVHHYQHDTFTANGKTLQESDRWTNVFYPDGSSTTVGAHTHILDATGLVLRDAGRIVMDADGAVTFIAGPHPQFLGTTFCDALLP